MHGSFKTVEFYHVLALFAKYYNKWLVLEEEKCPWVLVRVTTKSDSAFVDVQLEKDGDWGSQHVFCTVKFDNIVK
eukprot:15240376-Ditylum_brightwellii.AAC.1